MFATPQQISGPGGLDTLDLENTPYADYLDGDSGFDLGDSELGGQSTIGALDGDNGLERHEKRKKSEVEADDEEEEGDAKRKEGDDKQAKKPGRKPLTNEPTTKRKAQNRAAQRAFRERKEAHLKDLETKVEELTKTTEEDKQQNEILRAQVARLQAELGEYRKRMSSDASRTRSPPVAASLNGNGDGSKGNFAFDFPAFGALPGGQVFGPSGYASTNGVNNSNISPTESSRPKTLRHNSSGRQHSPTESGSVSRSSSEIQNFNNANSVSSTKSNVASNSSMDSFAGLFSPGLLKGTKFGTENNEYGFPMGTNSSTNQIQSVPQDNGTDSTSGLSRVFRFNSGSNSSNTESPSQSSLSQFNGSSSCQTSPVSSHPSPPKDAAPNTLHKVQNGFSLDNTANMNAFSNIGMNNAGIDWLASQNGGQFDPVLFGDYRESQDAIVGDGDFNNGFFNDAFPFDFGSPLNFDLNSPKAVQQPSPAVQKQAVSQQPSKDCLAQAERIREGLDDDVILSAKLGCNIAPNGTTAPPANMLNANTIWNQLQNNKDFQDGKFDLDALCGELRAKAKCSESGVVVPANEVDKAFQKLGGKPVDAIEHIAWQQDMVDDAFKRLSSAGSNWGGMGI